MFGLTLNPFALVRRLFSRRTLSEIIADFETKRTELDAFFARTERKVEKQVARIALLELANAVHNDHMSKAQLISDNLRVLMTQTIGTTVEPPASGEAP